MLGEADGQREQADGNDGTRRPLVTTISDQPERRRSLALRPARSMPQRVQLLPHQATFALS
jgi:hypothetical protein